MRKKLHPMTFIDACWTFTETKQWMLAQWGGGWRVSAVATATWKTSHVPDGHAQLSHDEMKSVSISSSARIGRLRLGNCVRSWILAAMRWKRWWQCWNITKFAPGGSHECSHRTIKNTVCKFVRTYWTNMRLKVTVSWIASSPVTKRGVTTTSQSQNSSPWSGDMWIQIKSSRRCPQQVKWCALSFGIGKGWSFWISLNPDKPLTLTATSQCWLSWRLEFPESGQRRRHPFSCNTDNARPQTSLKPVEHIANLGWTVLPHPPYSPDLAPSDFHLFGPMKDRLNGQHFPSNDAIVQAVKQWATSAGADFYECGKQALVHRWRKCIANDGDYVEK